MPDQDAPRKPPRRIWLVAPYILVALAFLGWSAGWMVLKGQMETHMDQATADLRAALTGVGISGSDVKPAAAAGGGDAAH